jgi:hypothetical protein
LTVARVKAAPDLGQTRSELRHTRQVPSNVLPSHSAVILTSGAWKIRRQDRRTAATRLAIVTGRFAAGGYGERFGRGETYREIINRVSDGLVITGCAVLGQPALAYVAHLDAQRTGTAPGGTPESTPYSEHDHGSDDGRTKDPHMRSQSAPVRFGVSGRSYRLLAARALLRPLTPDSMSIHSLWKNCANQ